MTSRGKAAKGGEEDIFSFDPQSFSIASIEHDVDGMGGFQFTEPTEEELLVLIIKLSSI